MTAITEPTIMAWTTARSALSAKNSMKTKITAVMKNRTTHRLPGMTPTAPWMRSDRACSRSAGVVTATCRRRSARRRSCGSVAFSVLNSADAPGIRRVHRLLVRGRQPWPLVHDETRVTDKLVSEVQPDGVR